MKLQEFGISRDKKILVYYACIVDTKSLYLVKKRQPLNRFCSLAGSSQAALIMDQFSLCLLVMAQVI
jgi:hypothetical protein